VKPLAALLVVLTTLVALPAIRGDEAAAPVLRLSKPMAQPTWALLERELLRQNVAACKEFYDRYFDERGFLLVVERWGGDDGPDDAAEAVNDWPLLHAIGASDEIRTLYRRSWEGHLRQYTLAKTTEVPLARDGMYYKEFPTQFDWLHNGEGLAAFNLHGLSDPTDPAVVRRTKRYAGFYLNEDPGAQNYDPQHHLIRSMFNGSRGPLLRKATALDWAGDPIEVKNRFKLGHGEESYEQMLLHFKDYNDVVGDHPQNLLTTNLALNAYALTGDEKYRRWVVDYVDAWKERLKQNGDIIPTNIGLDGKIGSDAGGKWYGGVYGWGFSVYDPATKTIAHRNQHQSGFSGFANAFLLTGDDSYLDAWRRQIDKINAQKKTVDGKTVYPRMYGDKGWYDFAPAPYSYGAVETYLLTMRDDDRRRCPPNPWLDYLDGKNPGYPEQALAADMNGLRQKVAAIRKDDSTPDTRLADDPMFLNPAAADSLAQLTLGCATLPRIGKVLSSRLRYFDPTRGRAGLPEDTAALVEKMDGDSTTVTLVNLNVSDARTVVVQAGAYGEHTLTSAQADDQRLALNDRAARVRLEPGCGARITLKMRRHTRRPTLAFPSGVTAAVDGSDPTDPSDRRSARRN
jgi:hypothetical protein